MGQVGDLRVFAFFLPASVWEQSLFPVWEQCGDENLGARLSPWTGAEEKVAGLLSHRAEMNGLRITAFKGTVRNFFTMSAVHV
jgi:hypothetical protein